MNCRLAVAAVCAGLALAPIADATVSLKNGNFYVPYVDVAYPGGFEPKIERVYNSKSPFSGMFGARWGTEYEVYLTFEPDGSVVLHEYGGGADNRFVPEKAVIDKETVVRTILAAAQRENRFGADEDESAYAKRLSDDLEYREDEWKALVRTGRVETRHVVVGTRLHSMKFGSQWIVREPEGYERRTPGGRIEQFNLDGRLVRVSDRNNNYIVLRYDHRGKLAQISDNFGRTIGVVIGERGLVERLTDDHGRSAEFRYARSTNLLVYSRDIAGNEYRFEYDTPADSNLTAIRYSDGTVMEMTYYGNDQKQNVKSVRDRDGTLTTYTYQSFNELHFRIDVVISGSDDDTISKSAYEYFMHPTANGAPWQRRLVTTVDGDITDTTYDESTGMPLSVRRGKETTRFRYDENGNVIYKETPVEVTELEYDPRVGKVSKVSLRDKRGDKRSWSRFAYDQRGNLVLATNSERMRVTLTYDGFGRIDTIADGEQRLSFVYDRNSKPVEISVSGIGKISVKYSDSGEIEKVDSDAQTVQSAVTSAFQRLLDVIRPAGVKLSF